jgi:hypothetical protein
MKQRITIEELKQRIGQIWLTLNYPMECGLLRRFAEAVGDDNRRWQTEVPPSLLFTIGLEQVCERLLALPKTVLHESGEIECFAQAKLGDNIAVVIEVEDVRERLPFTFISLEMEQHNQNSMLVARCKQLVVLRSIL